MSDVNSLEAFKGVKINLERYDFRSAIKLSIGLVKRKRPTSFLVYLYQQ